MLRVAIFCVVMSALLEAGVAASGEAQVGPDPSVKRLYSCLRPLFLKHYPQAVSEVRADRLHFEHDTRTFLIHVPLKTGEWQEAAEVRGPNRRGIVCNIQLVEGKYNGQAVLPQTIDERYFKTLVTAVASQRRDAYLYVHLSYPDGVGREFMREFTGVLDRFWSEE